MLSYDDDDDDSPPPLDPATGGLIQHEVWKLQCNSIRLFCDFGYCKHYGVTIKQDIYEGNKDLASNTRKRGTLLQDHVLDLTLALKSFYAFSAKQQK